MKKVSVLALAVVMGSMAGTAIAADAASGATVAKSTSNVGKISYATGYQIGEKTPADMDIDQFVQGLRDAKAKKAMIYTQEELTQAMQAYQQVVQAKQQQASQQNAAAGAAFLAENGKKAGVVTTKSGLQYQVLKEATGKRPKASSKVTVHYEGKLIDGTVFDSSIARKEPASFVLNQVIPGWTEGLQLMQKGAKYRFFIPPALGYGDQEAGSIPAGSVLIFDVELLDVAN